MQRIPDMPGADTGELEVNDVPVRRPREEDVHPDLWVLWTQFGEQCGTLVHSLVNSLTHVHSLVNSLAHLYIVW